jgi:hypothetical protein
MLIVREGTEGTIAIALPHAYVRASEAICDALTKAYPKATVRVVVNHCLAPEILRADKIDVAAARMLIEALRKNAPPAEEPSTLRERCAVALGWTEEETRAFSLRALRDLVKPHDVKLATMLDRAIATSQGEKAYCCFCSNEVAPADFVVFTNAEGERPAHKSCVDAYNTRTQYNAELTQIHLVMRALFVSQPDVAWSHVSEEYLRAVTRLVIASLL